MLASSLGVGLQLVWQGGEAGRNSAVLSFSSASFNIPPAWLIDEACQGGGDKRPAGDK
jgi:hypothetical protein